MRQPKPILVAGGGIGGLAAALGLARKSFRVTVLERAAALGEIGAIPAEQAFRPLAEGGCPLVR